MGSAGADGFAGANHTSGHTSADPVAPNGSLHCSGLVDALLLAADCDRLTGQIAVDVVVVAAGKRIAASSRRSLDRSKDSVHSSKKKRRKFRRQ